MRNFKKLFSADYKNSGGGGVRVPGGQGQARGPGPEVMAVQGV